MTSAGGRPAETEGGVTVANDNEVDAPYEVRMGRTARDHEPYWTVYPKGGRWPISMRFPTRELAYRCRNVLIADDRRLEATRKRQA